MKVTTGLAAPGGVAVLHRVQPTGDDAVCRLIWSSRPNPAALDRLDRRPGELRRLDIPLIGKPRLDYHA